MRLRPALACALLVLSVAAPGYASDCGEAAPLDFGHPVVVDPDRPGADPALVRHPTGVLVLTAAPLVQRTESQPDAGFLTSFTGQSAIWRSTDGGTSWTYVGVPDTRAGPSRAAAAGTADPDLTLDAAGTIYHSEANALAATVTRSEDTGLRWPEPNRTAVTGAERPWVAGDGAGVVYLTANQAPDRSLYRSTDGGRTFSKVAVLTGGYSKPSVDLLGGIVASYTRLGPAPQPGTMVGVSRIPGARSGDFTVGSTTIARGQFNIDQDNSGVDAAGNVYVVWTRRLDREGQPVGVWLSTSTDRGATFSAPKRLDRDSNPDDLTLAMPTVVAGRAGHVAVAWLQSSRSYRKDDPAGADAEWSLRVAISTDAAGCGPDPRFALTEAVQGPIHVGTICAGTFCDVASGRDSRMGRSLAGTTTPDGRLVIAFPTTAIAGAVAHPAIVVSTGGPRL